MPKVKLIIRAWNTEGYQRDIIVMDELQTRIIDSRVKGSYTGPIIYPKDFPEMVKFEVILEDMSLYNK